MVESAAHQPPEQSAPRGRSSEIEEQARRLATEVEARTGCPRANGGDAPPLDRVAARALVEAGYMPLADYVALYGQEVTAEAARQARLQRTGQVTGHFPVAFPRRQTYRPTSVSLAKPTPRPKRRGRR